ncbi:cation efflux family protein [Sulfobacillus acidophilus TPY]|uniref:Cation diffusion facilitator family transporter n=1 Tax=Sulfobacillus acidophilus (strain ATCC 700253 / DSM 10332 / NAL) TaxID=679936 RepID=G8TXT0_SULAD|nr:cation efflux family protein [Sulfobacillus acidophilus TPY]AEW05036.1 cation diffusion facilitator family transporter [Sulfobacillus acidophilus DSM 10332]
MTSHEEANRGSSWINLISNLGLMGFKLIVGIVGHSEALIADGIHSGADVLSSVAVVIGLWVAGRPPDEGHNYGHAKAEAISQKVVAVLLLLAGLEVANSALQALHAPHAVPDRLTLGVALLAMVIKGVMAWSQTRLARVTGSHAILASAVDNRVDAVSSLIAAAGIAATRGGWRPGDAVSALLVAAMIIWGGVSVFTTAAQDLMDPAADAETVEHIRSAILGVPGVQAISLLRTRVSGTMVLVDVEIDVARDLSLVAAHDIAHRVHDVVLGVPRVSAATVHVNPAEDEKR